MAGYNAAWGPHNPNAQGQSEHRTYQETIARLERENAALRAQPQRNTQHSEKARLSCPNCGKDTHNLRCCDGPLTRDGFLQGCPHCNTKSHGLWQCKNVNYSKLKHYILTCRSGKAPIEMPMDWRQIIPTWNIRDMSGEVHCPLTIAFVRQRAAADPNWWQRHRYIQGGAKDVVPHDPSWSRMASVPFQTPSEGLSGQERFINWIRRKIDDQERKRDTPNQQYGDRRERSRSPVRTNYGNYRQRSPESYHYEPSHYGSSLYGPSLYGPPGQSGPLPRYQHEATPHVQRHDNRYRYNRQPSPSQYEHYGVYQREVSPRRKEPSVAPNTRVPIRECGQRESRHREPERSSTTHSDITSGWTFGPGRSFGRGPPLEDRVEKIYDNFNTPVNANSGDTVMTNRDDGQFPGLDAIKNEDSDDDLYSAPQVVSISREPTYRQHNSKTDNASSESFKKLKVEEREY